MERKESEAVEVAEAVEQPIVLHGEGAAGLVRLPFMRLGPLENPKGPASWAETAVRLSEQRAQRKRPRGT